MRTITIRQPWMHAILHFGKRVENRDWRAAPSYRGTILLHSAKGCTQDEYLDAYDFMRGVYCARPWEGSTLLPALGKLPRGAIVGRASLIAVEWNGNNPRDPWAVAGALGLHLADVAMLAEPIPWKGALGFFDVPDHVLVGAEWRAAA